MPSTTAAVAATGVAIAATALAALTLRKARRKRRVPATIPRPTGWVPVLGHGLLFLGSADVAVATFERLAWELGPLYVVELGAGRETLVVTDSELMQQLMRRRHTSTSPGGSFKSALESVDMGHAAVLIEDYDEWKALRRIMDPPFTPFNVKKMVPYILRSAEYIRGEIDKIADMQAAEIAARPTPGGFTGKAAVDLSPIFKKAAFDTMMLYGFDLDDNKFSKELSVDDFNKITTGVVSRIKSVYKLYRFYWTPEDREIQAAAERVRKTSFDIIQEARQRVEAGRASDIREHSVLDNFIKSQSPEEQNMAKLSVDSLAENVFGLLFAAYETTASTFDAALRILALYPDIQEQIHAEVTSALAPGWQDPTAEPASFDAKSLPYTHAFIKEVNRLYPLASVLPMDAKTDLDLGGHVIPAGTPLMLLTRVAALRATSFEDGFAFRPDRWIELENDPERREAESRAIMSFGGGARICPGRHAAIAQLVVFTAVTVSGFKVSFLDVPPHLELAQSFLRLPVKFEKRN
ncbi:lanosterol 14-alpha-demethylase [Cladochytrium tenue]|nr:lanosterol 14-alpha-demethylase [Cladochytrium tenue]